jgi:tetrapyrrole methylase family protein/MazG family protein
MSSLSASPSLDDFSELVGIVRRLRRECPWDREQTHQSLRGSLLEETYEVVESLDAGDSAALQHELGDLLLHVLMQATIAEENGEFLLGDVLRGLSSKLVRRHPHVFGEAKVESAETVRRNWEQLKMEEGRSSVLEGVPTALPALQRALRVQERAAGVGFDWNTADDVLRKVTEEAAEFASALSAEDPSRQQEELGDFLFAVVNYARHLKINPETSLRLTVEKFIRRFRYVEEQMRNQGRDLRTSSLKEMDDLWDEAKRRGI